MKKLLLLSAFFICIFRISHAQCTSTVVPGVTITADPATTICAGTSVTFTATTVNGGAAPTYQWSVNAVIIPNATNSTYTSANLQNADQITVRITSNEACASPTTAVSNAILMTVTTVVTPSVTITTAPAATICAGTSVTFTAQTGNGGTVPIFEWFINGASQGIASTAQSFTSTTLTNGDQISVKMQSSSGCLSAPVATSNVITMTVNPIPVASVNLSVDKTSVCPGDYITFTATPTNGGTAPTFIWGKNATIIAGETNSTYTTTGNILGSPNSITVQMISNETCAPTTPVASSAVVVTVNPVPVASVSITSDKPVICSGTTVTFTAAPINAGNPTYEWFIGAAGAEVSQGAASTGNNTFTTSALTATSNSVFVRIVSSLPCASMAPVKSNTIQTIVNPGITAGTIGSDQTICYNSIPAPITEIIAPSGTSGTLTYIWEVSPTGFGGPFTPIPGYINSGITPYIPVTQDVFIRRTVVDPSIPSPCNTATSNIVHITVRPQITAGVISGDQTICTGTIPAGFTSAAIPTGGTGTYTYQWQSDASGTMGHIASATNATYASGVLTATTKFQRVETSGTCGTVTSNIVTVTVTAPETVTVSINDPGQICAGAAAFNFTATANTTGTGTINYQWYLGSVAVGSNSSTYSYTPQNSDAGKAVKVVATTSTGCNTGPATSNIVTLDIINATTPTLTITTSHNPSCEGLQTTFTATATGTGNNPIYMWYVNATALGLGVTGPVTKNVLTMSSLQNGDQVYVELTSDHGCLIGTNPFISNKIIMTIKPIPSPVINEGDQTVCAGNTFTFTSTGSTGSIYQWTRNGAFINGAITSTYTTDIAGVYSLQEDNGTCNSTSLPVTLTIDPCGAFSTSIAGPNPITSGEQNAVYSVFDQTDFTYEWSIVGGTIVSGQNTHAVTVDWDPFPVAIARTAVSAYSISVKETNPLKQSKTTTLNVNELTTGVNKSLAQSGISLFPNPATESFNIEMPESGIPVKYEIVDLAGTSVAQGDFISTGNAEKITTDFGAGIYQIILRYNNIVTCGRLSKLQ